MASSSLSQESLDRDESYEFASTRRTRMMPRGLRSRGAERNAALHQQSESLDSGDQNGYDMTGSVVETGTSGPPGGGGGGIQDFHHQGPGVAGGGGVMGGGGGGGVIGQLAGATSADHDSPTRTATSRARDKRARPNHLHKGKPAKDKRKLREKRRSTGAVHLPSTESTGDSLDDDDTDKLTGETKRNTSYNEVIDADNPQTPEENHLTRGYNRASRNKSPSDLEADLEDNQDYDSTVSQSETNLTTIGQSSPQSVLSNRLPGNLRSRTSPDTPRPLGSSREERESSRPVSYPSRIRDGAPRDLENASLESRSSYLSSRFRDAQDSCRSPSYQYHRSDRSGSSNTSSSNSADLIRLQARNTELERLLTSEREEKRRLQRQIEQERDEKSRLRQMLDSRDLQIVELQKELGLLNTDFDLCCEDIEKLQQENAALVRAFSQLNTT